MKKYINYTYVVLYACLLLPFAAIFNTAAVAPKLKINDHDQFYIKLFNTDKRMSVEFQPIEKNAFIHPHPIKIGDTISTYKYFVITYVTESHKRIINPSTNEVIVSPSKNKHLFITSIETKMDNNNPPISIYLFLTSTVRKVISINTSYHGVLSADDEDPPLPIPIPGVGKFDNLHPPYHFLINQQNHLSSQMNISFKLIQKIKDASTMTIADDEDPPFPIPIPGVGDNTKYFFAALINADDEDPPFPIPIPGVGNTINLLLSPKPEMERAKPSSIHQYMQYTFGKEVSTIHQYIFIPVNNVTEDDNSPITVYL